MIRSVHLRRAAELALIASLLLAGRPVVAQPNVTGSAASSLPPATAPSAQKGAVAPAPTSPSPGVASSAAPHPSIPATAVPTPVPASPDPEAQALQALTQTIDKLKAEEGSVSNDEQLVKLRAEAAAAQAAAEGDVTERAHDLAPIATRLSRLSTKSGAARPRLDAAEVRERRLLLARNAKLHVQLTDAERVAAFASETYNAISNRRRASFTSDVFQRTTSPLEAGFWTSLSNSLQPDTVRLERLISNAAQAVRQAPEPRGALSVAVALLIALVLLIPIRRMLKRLSVERVRGGHTVSEFGRVGHALAVVLIDTALPGVAALSLSLGLSWGDLLTAKAEELVQAGVVAVFWGAAILALSRQLAGSTDPRERVLSVSERVAKRMAALPILVAIITGSGFLLNRVTNVVGASLAATIATNCLIALAYAGVASLVLVALGAAGSVEDEPERKPDPPPIREAAPGQVLLSLVLTAAIVVTVGAVFAGFTTLAALLSRQIFWISVLAAATYLLLRFVDAGMALLFKPRGLISRLLVATLNLRVSVTQQLGVLASALLQIAIVLAALGLGFTPFNRNGEMLALHVGHIGDAVHLGSLTISPASVGVGVLILLLGLGLSHLVERWFDRRYLPVTDWDAGVRNSVSTGVRYLGVSLAVVWALAAAGLGFKQIALVASALSVGIGFGLQQIVQNFVSGLILLVERPVKVGDWVNLGGLEGDVRRIRVRATEIETFDRTTVIVPNSDLITKQVQNKTLGDPFGRVQLKFTVGAAADAPRATQVTEEVMRTDAGVLDDPKPLVLIDSLTEAGAVNYTCFAYVASQRDAMRAKSRLYGSLIKAFAEAKVGFVGGPATVIVQPGGDLTALADRLSLARSTPSTGDVDKPEGDVAAIRAPHESGEH